MVCGGIGVDGDVCSGGEEDECEVGTLRKLYYDINDFG
jgi:hypothetical protein